MNNVQIVPFDFPNHLDGVYELWQANFAERWPLSRNTFAQLLDASKYQTNLATYPFVAFLGDKLVGFVTAQNANETTKVGIINLLLVAPSVQRQGIGTALHNFVLALFERAEVTRAQLGGGVPTIWQGVPMELAEATAFFHKLIWDYPEASFDLIQDLQEFNNSQDFIGSVVAQDISFQTATMADIAAIVAFQQEKFPRWLSFYENVMELGDYHDILLAKDAAGELLGMLMMRSNSSNPQRSAVLWKAEFGDNAGSLDCVGIARKVNRQGIGSALVAYAHEILKERGVGICFISWTWRVSFYQRLGYKLWKSYHMGRRSMA